MQIMMSPVKKSTANKSSWAHLLWFLHVYETISVPIKYFERLPVLTVLTVEVDIHQVWNILVLWKRTRQLFSMSITDWSTDWLSVTDWLADWLSQSPQIRLLIVGSIFLLHEFKKLWKLNCPVPIEVGLQHQVQHLTLRRWSINDNLWHLILL